MSTNTERAARAGKAMSAVDVYSTLSDPDCLTDLLTDLMHFAGQSDIDFEQCLRLAGGNYQEELVDEIEVPEGLLP